MAAFLANVGVNASHAVSSPLHDDGTFELVPIPEPLPWRPPMVRGWRDHAVHVDPDFTSTPATYGDNCRRAGRAFSLRRAQQGDLIVFLARLVNHRPGFYLVGCLEIDDVLPDVAVDPRDGWWDGNAHVRRARATGSWDCFWVFKGGPRSTLFDHAVPFAREELTTVFGDGLRWPAQRTELQTIGSYTRAVRQIDGAGEEWLRSICPS
jgi:putative DNA base modification enzyme with NMAD domain